MFLYFQGGAPLHYRDIHWFNAPYIFKYCLKMVTPVLSKRILDCTYLYDSLDDAVKIAGGEDMAPEEFGGTLGPMDATPVLESQLQVAHGLDSGAIAGQDTAPVHRRCSQSRHGLAPLATIAKRAQ